MNKCLAITGAVLVIIVLLFELATGEEVSKYTFFLWGSISVALVAIGFRVVGYSPKDPAVKRKLKEGLAWLFSFPLLIVIAFEVKQNTGSAIFGVLLGSIVYFVVWDLHLSARVRKDA